MLALAPLLAAAQPAPVNTMRHRAGDDPRWAAPDWDDRDWAPGNNVPGRAGIHWVRFRFTPLSGGGPGFLPDAPMRDLSGIDLVTGFDRVFLAAPYSYAFYWDGKLVGRNGTVGATREAETPGRLDNVFVIPPDLRGPGGHVVAIRLSGFHYNFPCGLLQCRVSPEQRRGAFCRGDPAARVPADRAGRSAAGGADQPGAVPAGGPAAQAPLLAAAWAMSPLYEIKAPWLCRAMLAMSLGIAAWAGSRRRAGAWFVFGGVLAGLLLVKADRRDFLDPWFFAIFSVLVLYLFIMLGLQLRADRRQAQAALLTAARLDESPVGLLLLDLNLHGRDGMELLQASVAGSFHTIVVSANTEQALRAFEFGVVDFVPKPFSRERLAQALARVTERDGRAAGAARYLAVKKYGKVELVEIDRILYVKGAGSYAELVLDNGRTERHDKTLEKLHALLPPGFERIHKSYVVRWSAVKALHAAAGSHDEAELRNGVCLPIGRARYKEIREKLP